MKKKILVIVAHPDDEVLGCGGSMAKWIKAGNDVQVLFMAEGLTSRDKERNRKNREKELSSLAKSAKKACKILGIRSFKLLEYPDNRMDSMDLLDIVKTIEEFVKKVNPQVVITHHSGDFLCHSNYFGSNTIGSTSIS